MYGDIFYELTFGFFERLKSLSDLLYDFLYQEINVPVFITIVGEGNVQWITVQVINILGPTFIVFLVGWLVQKITPLI